MIHKPLLLDSVRWRAMGRVVVFCVAVIAASCASRAATSHREYKQGNDQPPQAIDHDGNPSPISRDAPDVQREAQITAIPDEFLSQPPGYDALKLWHAAQLYMAVTGQYPNSHSAIAGPLAIHGRPLEYTLGVGTTGAPLPVMTVLFAEQPVMVSPYASLAVEDYPVMPDNAATDPPLGLTPNGAARYLLHSPHESAYYAVPPTPAQWSHEYDNLLDNLSHSPLSPYVDPAVYPFTWLDPQRTPENYRLGALLEFVTIDLSEYQIVVSENIDFTTLTDLRALFEAAWGPGTDAAWANPYTGGPMLEVPLELRSPGNYSVVLSNGEPVILIHYLDAENGVSSVSFGIAPPVPQI